MAETGVAIAGSAYILQQGEAGRRVELQHVPEPAGLLDFGLNRVAFEGDFDRCGVASVVLGQLLVGRRLFSFLRSGLRRGRL